MLNRGYNSIIQVFFVKGKIKENFYAEEEKAAVVLSVNVSAREETGTLLLIETAV